MTERARAAAVLGVLAVAAMVGAQSGGPPEGEKAAKSEPTTTLMPEMEGVILEAAREYPQWNRVSDVPHMTPWQCWLPPPRGVQESSSNDGDTHGQKLYFLYARNGDAYLKLFEDRGFMPLSVPAAAFDPSRFEQILVKESWAPLECDASTVPDPPNWQDRTDRNPPAHPYYVDPVSKKAYVTGHQRDLFMMLKVDPSTPGTDEGWIYAVVDPKEKKVRASGRLENCMGCHQGEGTRDRLFGPK